MASFVLPEAPKVLGNYQPYIIRNGIGSISGQFPIKNGELLYQGKVGEELSVSDAKHAIEIAALNVLSQLSNASNGFADLDGILRMDAYIASGHSFYQHAEVVDVASNLLVNVLGQKGAHARSAIGVSQLPLNSSIELVVSFSMAP
ncbi:RidA family protein [Vibrio echinoideorum]|uniref:RidA family protein n=1 Tax=Vibrio echinoideorum TaxID=2100116 RepID=A0ABU9FQJ6_9VIBR